MRTRDTTVTDTPSPGLMRPAAGINGLPEGRSRRLDLTCIASLPNVSSCPKEHTGTPGGGRVRRGQPTKPKVIVLSALRAGLCRG
jgi:hypothetical protein